MHLTLERKIAAAFGVALILLVAIGTATWISLARFERAFALVEHTHVVLNRLEQIQVQALEVQTGSRGYALSGDIAFLGPHDSGVERIRESLAAVAQLTADNPAEQERVRQLGTHVEREIALMSRRNELRRTQGLAGALDAETLREGKLTMDRIRALIREMEDAENALLASRAQDAQTSAAVTRGALLLAVAVILVLAAAAGTRIARDFRARQRSDDALRRSRTMFETFFEQSTDAIVVVDDAGKIRRVNRRSEDLFGYPRAALLGQPVEILMPGRFRTPHVAHVQGFQAAPKFRAMGAGLELFARRQDGVEFPVDIMLSPLETDEDRVVLAAVRDITERKAVAAELQRSADRIRDLYNRAPCGYHSLDPQGLIIDINDTELEWLGYTRDEIVGRKHFLELLTPASAPLFAASFLQFKQTGAVSELEFQLLRRDGSAFYVSLSATAIYDDRGDYLMSRSTVHNIDARRAAEQRLAALHEKLQEHSTRLEEANGELEAFSYSVSHDLRAPLRHLAGFSHLLLERERGRLDAESQRYVETIVSSARRMSELIDALLDFSQLGRQPMLQVRVDSQALVGEVLAEKHFDAAPDTEWRLDPLPPVEADPALLRQVWTNLLGNAAKYSARSRPPRIHVSAELSRDGREVTFAVRDNGVGFDPRYADKLFKVFSRLHGDREFRGTGIGLALVQRIVTRHGGRVWAEGRPAAGATFFFTLPTAPTP